MLCFNGMKNQEKKTTTVVVDMRNNGWGKSTVGKRKYEGKQETSLGIVDYVVEMWKILIDKCGKPVKCHKNIRMEAIKTVKIVGRRKKFSTA